MNSLAKNPAFLLAIGLVGLILFGAVSLGAASLAYGPDLDLADHIFTATSALTVTGLVVTDTAALPLVSQIIILILIQIGGIGIMTAFGFLLTVLRRDWGFKTHITLKDALDRDLLSEVKALVYFIIKTTFIFEGIGVVLFFIFFSRHMEVLPALFFSVFHAVSAFCNAGFMLFTDGFIGFRDNTYINLVTAFLIIAGGLGFTAMLAIKTRIVESIKKSYPKTKISLEVKIILIGGLFLIILGTGLLFLFELHNPELGDIKSKFLVSFFQSISARTAGFNTVDMDTLSDASRFVIMNLMFVGGAPASTSGGIKVTAAFILLFGMVAFTRSETEISVWKRTIDLPTILKTFSVVAISLFFVLVFIVALMFFEDVPPEKAAFEAFSAFGTVGYSTGVAGSVETGGKLILTALMFLGRIGPISLFFIYTAHSKKKRHSEVSYIKEKVAVG